MRVKLPELKQESVNVFKQKKKVREIVCSNKIKGRVYANENRGAVSKSIDVEGEVLLGADKSNRLSKLPKDRMRGHSEE